MATEREELIAKAGEMGLEFKKNMSTVDLQLLVDEAEQEAADKAIEEKASKAETASVEVSEKIVAEKNKASGMRSSTEMVKVIVTALDPRMREIPSDMFTHMGKFGTKKQVVKFGKEQLVFKVITDMLAEKKSLQQVKRTSSKGREITTYQMSPAFMIQEIPLTAEELAEIQGK